VRRTVVVGLHRPPVPVEVRPQGRRRRVGGKAPGRGGGITAKRCPLFRPEQAAAADALQRSLRSRFRARLSRSVRHAFHRSGKEVRQQ
jgi:hypothetical protein